MKTLYYFLGFSCVAIVCCSQEDKFAKDDTSKSKSSKDEKTVENIMSMIQGYNGSGSVDLGWYGSVDLELSNNQQEETCTRDNRGKTVKQLKKDSNSILNSIKEYRQIVNIKQAMQRDIKWIVKESKGHGGVESFMRAIKRDVKDICRPFRVRDCTELSKIKKKSGVYTIYADQSKGSKGIEAFCDMTTDGGGWTVIQRRIDGSVNFARKWTEYEDGFGTAEGEYWLGNKEIHRLTSTGRYKLRVDLEYSNGNNKYAIYNTFIVGDAASKYKLTVGGYSGDAGDRFVYHNGQKFSTVDQDNDTARTNCASAYPGGWWYHKGCYHVFLNAKFQGKMHWADTCKKAVMMIRKL